MFAECNGWWHKMTYAKHKLRVHLQNKHDYHVLHHQHSFRNRKAKKYEIKTWWRAKALSSALPLSPLPPHTLRLSDGRQKENRSHTETRVSLSISKSSLCSGEAVSFWWNWVMLSSLKGSVVSRVCYGFQVLGVKERSKTTGKHGYFLPKIQSSKTLPSTVILGECIRMHGWATIHLNWLTSILDTQLCPLSDWHYKLCSLVSIKTQKKGPVFWVCSLLSVQSQTSSFHASASSPEKFPPSVV